MSNRYSATWGSPNGPNDARPTALQVISDEGLEGDKLSDKTVLITGTSSGLGVETVRAMVATGARVFCTARDLSKAKLALADINIPDDQLLTMDQNSLASVREAAKLFLSRSGNKLNILICNAGIMALPSLIRTVDGYEAQFGVNHLSHFLLFNLVKDAMLASSTSDFQSRVVMVSSSGQRFAAPQVGNYDFSSPGGMQYSPSAAYGQSKTANVYMANYIDRVYGPQGIHALSLHPGSISTGLQVHVQAMADAMAQREDFRKYRKSSAQGAATQVYAAVGKEWEGKGGFFLEDCDISPLLPDNSQNMWDRGYKAQAFDPKAENRLWEDSIKMVGL